jgi:hypothetical protein
MNTIIPLLKTAIVCVRYLPSGQTGFPRALCPVADERFSALLTTKHMLSLYRSSTLYQIVLVLAQTHPWPIVLSNHYTGTMPKRWDRAPSCTSPFPKPSLQKRAKAMLLRAVQCIGRESNPGLADVVRRASSDGNGQFYH